MNRKVYLLAGFAGVHLFAALAQSAPLAGLNVSPVVTSNFDSTKPGALPANWLGTKTGAGTQRWAVAFDATAPSGGQVLKQSGEATYPVCLMTDSQLKDGIVEVKFKPVSGREDQAGGIIWRAKDAANYYVCRANALEDNVRIYRVVAGQRIQFDTANLRVTGGQWHTLRVEFSGPSFIAFLDGKKVLTAKDATFAVAGMVGVWTKADSVTAFDDFACSSK